MASRGPSRATPGPVTMDRWRRPFAVSWVVLATTVAMLLTLAWLQYRWSGQASEAQQEQMRRGLAVSAEQFRVELSRSLLRPCDLLRVSAGTAEELRLAIVERVRELSRTDSLSDLVSGVYLAFPGEAASWSLERVQPEGGTLAVPWPRSWSALPDELTFNTRMSFRSGPRGGFDAGPGPGPRPDSGMLPGPMRGARPCMLDGESFVMHRVVRPSPAGERLRPEGRFAPPVGYILIEFSASHVQRELLPELVQRYFGSPADLGYRVAIVRGEAPADALFQSNPAPTVRLAEADAALSLFQFQPPEPGRRLGPGVMPIRGSRPWFLLAQHPSGSLATEAARLRLRNLALGFGVLLLLAANTALVLYSAQRARLLARLQMDFVAGVSHELRTPVTAVCMVADNLADGVVETPVQARQYGTLLRQQGRRLATMVEQILLFASHQQQPPHYTLRPVSVADVVADAISSERPLIEAAGMRTEVRLDDGLPDVDADPAALRRCVENLLGNAVKYGVQGAWIGVRAEVSGDHREVAVTVEDRGAGIAPQEQAHLFEPFYRGAAAREAQVPGTGLGLSLVRQMMEAMGGRVTVQSRPGQGSAFTLHLVPAAAGPRNLQPVSASPANP